MDKLLRFWKNRLIPAVMDIDPDSGKYLQHLIALYEEYGLTGHPLLNTMTFAPSRCLAGAFYWEETEMGRDHWSKIDMELRERGIYGDQ